jgi:hypothetical protein
MVGKFGGTFCGPFGGNPQEKMAHDFFFSFLTLQTHGMM